MTQIIASARAEVSCSEASHRHHSGEPHLHIHVQRRTDPEAPLRGEPLSVTFDGVFPLKNARMIRD